MFPVELELPFELSDHVAVAACPHETETVKRKNKKKRKEIAVAFTLCEIQLTTLIEGGGVGMFLP